GIISNGRDALSPRAHLGTKREQIPSPWVFRTVNLKKRGRGSGVNCGEVRSAFPSRARSAGEVARSAGGGNFSAGVTPRRESPACRWARLCGAGGRRPWRRG